MAEASIYAYMSQVAREVNARDNVEQAGDRICAAAVELLGPHAQAGISLAHRKHHVENVGATADVVRRGDALQVELGKGPCLDAMWQQEQVVAADLAQDDRWPRWGPTMVQEYGLRSMLATQLFTTREQLGALNVYSVEPAAFDEEAQEVIRILAAHAAVAVAAAQQVQHLSVAIDRRTTIGKALGIIMAQHDLDDARAFSVLQRLSRHHNRKLYDIADEVVRTRKLVQDG